MSPVFGIHVICALTAVTAAVLPQAKEKYEQEERRKELKRARGEDTWMLPDVDLRLQQLDQVRLIT